MQIPFRQTRRLRTPTVLQMEAVECGAACLGMVLGYYGLTVPLETLRYMCGVSRDGTKANNMLLTARHYGMEAQAYSTEPQGLDSLPLPLIIFWNFNHFVVMEGRGPGVVYLNDPAAGPRTVTSEEFDDAFTGIAIKLLPGPDFKKGGHRPTAWGGLVKRMRGSLAPLSFIGLASLGLLVPGLLVPTFSRVFVDYYLIQGFTNWLPPLLLCMVGTAVISAVLTGLQQRYLLRLQTKLALVESSRFFWHVLRLPIGFFAQRYGGEVGSRVALNDKVADLIAGELAVTVLSLATMLVYAIIMVQYDWLMSILAVTFAALNLIAFALVSRSLADGSQKLLQDEGKLMGVTMQVLQLMESFKASGTEDLLFTRWAGYHAKVVNAEQALSKARVALGVSPVLLAMMGSAAILMVGGFRVMQGEISIGTLVAFQALMASFTAPVIGLVTLGGQMQEARGDMARLDDILAHDLAPDFQRETQEEKIGGAPEMKMPRLPIVGEPVERLSATAIAAAAPVAHQTTCVGLSKLTGRVHVRNVSFGFIPTEAPMIEGLSIDIEPGMRIALVGRSGSGKSTVGKLIAGLYEPWTGEILCDGRPLSTIPRQLLRNSLSMVDQEVSLFELSIADNISLLDPTMPKDRIIQAAKDAALHDEIAQRPENYDFKVQEGGRNFSGGQRQRLEIARALVINPSILILDEATSALDTIAEQKIIENIRRRGCSCVIIAHRLSTIRDCDEIIVMDRGKVVERGRHEQLLASGGFYAHLIEN